MSATNPQPQPEGPLSEQELAELERLENEATAAPWWYDEGELYWRLHGTWGWTSEQYSIPAQPINKQLIKAAKQSEVFEPYWPLGSDGPLIPKMRNALPRLLKELRGLRELVHRCVCADGAPGDYEGPRAECPVHGAIQALNEAQAELERLRRGWKTMEGWLETRPRLSPTEPGLAEDG